MGRIVSHLFCCHAAEDQIYALELERQLMPLCRSGRVRLWHPGHLLPSDERLKVTRRELSDADVALILLSPDFLYSDECDQLARDALQRQEQGLLRVLPVLVRPCELKHTVFGELPLCPVDRRARSVQDRDLFWQQVAEVLDQVLAELERAPFGPWPTLGRVVTETFRLDRAAQWEGVRDAGPGHRLFLLWGRRGQAVNLFAERACRLLSSVREVYRQVVKVPIRRVANADDMALRVQTALAEVLRSPGADLAPMMERITRRWPLFLVLGTPQDEGWRERERAALAAFVGQHLPPLLPRGGAPVQVLLMLEGADPAATLLPWVAGWAGRMKGPLGYTPLPEAVLPSWAEVAQVLERKGADEETAARIRAFYDRLLASEYPDIEDLANELDRHLE